MRVRPCCYWNVCIACKYDLAGPDRRYGRYELSFCSKDSCLALIVHGIKKQRVKDMSDKINVDSAYAINSRQEGKDVLSWIENFGLHLFEKDCKPHVSFQKGKSNIVLVLRIRRTLKKTAEIQTERYTISAYHCFFKTDDNGFTRFCVNGACDEDVEGLKDLMVDKAQWTDESTQNWWKEVFRDLKHPIDEDTLRRKEILVSDSLKMNMMDFIEKIQEIIEKAIRNLCVDKQDISKVCIVEQFATALPLRYAIESMFLNAKGHVFPFEWKEEKMSWVQNASRFQVPGKLLYTSFITSHQISIGDILNQENGILITLSLSQGENENFEAPSTSIIDNADIKWIELLKGDITPDYIVDNVAFKQLYLSVIADGFQRIYIRNGMNVVACSIFDRNKYTFKSVSSIKSEQTQNPTAISNSGQEKTGKEGRSIGNSLQAEPSLGCDSQTLNTSMSEFQTTIDQNEIPNSPLSLDEGENKEIVATSSNNGIQQEKRNYKEKCNDIKLALGEALDRTSDFLKEIARSYLQKLNPQQKWDIQYGEALKKDKYQHNTWIEHKEVEFSNFFFFLVRFQWKIKGKDTRASWWKSYSDIESAVKYLIIVRNFRVHKKDNVVGIGYDNIYDAFREMRKIASKLNNSDLLHDIERYETVFKASYDSSMVSLWKASTTLQEIFKEFESEISKYN